MKKKLIDAIKAKFVGIDDNTAKRLAENIIKKGEPLTTDEEVAAAADAVQLSDVIKSVSDFSADDATRRYESKYNLKDGKPVEDPNTPPVAPQATPPAGNIPPAEGGGTAGENAELKAFKEMFAQFQSDLTKKLGGLEEGIASIKSGKIAENRKQRLDALIKDLRDTQKKAYGRISYEKMSDDEFESLLSDVAEEVNDLIAENKAAGAVVSAPLGGMHTPPTNGKEANKDELDALVGKFGLTPNQQ